MCRVSDRADAAYFRIVRSDGPVRWIGHVCKPVFFPDENAFGRRTSNQDVTDLKKSEQELLRLNQTLRAVSTTNHAMMHATDETGFLEDVCRIVVEDCGHAVVWVGFAEEDEAKSVWPVAQAGFDQGYVEALRITWADTERGRGPTGTAIRTGRPAFCRNMLTDPDFAPWREKALKGGYASSIALPLLQDGKAFGAITIYSREPDSFSDEEVGLLSELAGNLAYGITSLRSRVAQAETERALSESEERYRTLFESMKEAFVVGEMIYDDAGKPSDFRHLNVNPAFTGLTGLPADRVVGRTIREVIPGFEPFWTEAFDRVVKSGLGERVEGLVSNLGRQYEAFAWRSGPGRFAVVFSDITARKEAERRLRELNETLEQRVFERTIEAEDRAVQLWALTSRLTQVELHERQRLAGLLHDHLQQVLVAAKFKLDALAGRLGDTDSKSLAGRIDALLDDAISECRSVTGRLSPPVLRESGLAAALGWLARHMQEQQGLRVDLAADDDGVEPADADLKTFLFDAVRELLFNVVKHSGVLEARIAMERAGGGLRIVVEDQGKGFDQKALSDRRWNEIGFGLFSIRQRMELFGGSMSLESAPGRGTRVTLRALLKPGPEEAAPAAVPLAEPVPASGPGPQRAPSRSGRIRVVIADDHRILRQGLIALLKAEADIEVVGEAADGIEAVELARSLRPDVVIMDVSMPRMNGIQATRRIVAELPGVRIVGLSMHEDEAIAASMREAGAVEFVTKGGRSDALTSAIHAAVRGGTGQREG